MNEETSDYIKGRTDARLDVIEKEMGLQKKINESHEKRLQIMERMLYGLIGAFGLIAFASEIRQFLA